MNLIDEVKYAGGLWAKIKATWRLASVKLPAIQLAVGAAWFATPNYVTDPIKEMFSGVGSSKIIQWTATAWFTAQVLQIVVRILKQKEPESQ